MSNVFESQHPGKCSGFRMENLDYSKILNIAFWSLWMVLIFSLLTWFVGIEFIVEKTKEKYLYKSFFVGFSIYVSKSIYSLWNKIFTRSVIVSDCGIMQSISGKEILFEDVDKVYVVFLYNIYKRLPYLTPLAIVFIILSFLPFGWILFCCMVFLE